jgi:hypothetical protein
MLSNRLNDRPMVGQRLHLQYERRTLLRRALSAGQRESLNALDDFKVGKALPVSEKTPASPVDALEKLS